MSFGAILSLLLRGEQAVKRKKTDTVQLSKIRIREELRLRLIKDAEKAAKSLNAEIVDRLEASYSKDERIEELRERLEDLTRRNDEAQKALEADKEKFAAQAANAQRELFERVADAKRGIEVVRAEQAAQTARLEAELESERGRLEAAEAIFNALVGEDIPAREALRSMALFLAGNPGWANNPDGIVRVTEAANAAIQAAANKRAPLTGTVSATVAGYVSAPLTGTVSATLPSIRTTVAGMSEYASTGDQNEDQNVASQGGGENERAR
jgi:hypothetical protein